MVFAICSTLFVIDITTVSSISKQCNRFHNIVINITTFSSVSRVIKMGCKNGVRCGGVG